MRNKVGPVSRAAPWASQVGGAGIDSRAMGVDSSPSIETGASEPYESPVERRRRRRSHRAVKRKPAVRRVRRLVAILLLGAAVILASLFFAQRFTTYEPPSQVWE